MTVRFEGRPEDYKWRKSDLLDTYEWFSSDLAMVNRRLDHMKVTEDHDRFAVIYSTGSPRLAVSVLMTPYGRQKHVYVDKMKITWNKYEKMDANEKQRFLTTTPTWMDVWKANRNLQSLSDAFAQMSPAEVADAMKKISPALKKLSNKDKLDNRDFMWIGHAALFKVLLDKGMTAEANAIKSLVLKKLMESLNPNNPNKITPWFLKETLDKLIAMVNWPELRIIAAKHMPQVDESSIESVPWQKLERYEMDPEHQLQAVKEQPYALKWIANQTEEAQMAALVRDPRTIALATRPSERVQIFFVTKQPANLHHLMLAKHGVPDDAVCAAAIRAFPNNIKYLPHADKQLADLALKNGAAVDNVKSTDPSVYDDNKWKILQQILELAKGPDAIGSVRRLKSIIAQLDAAGVQWPELDRVRNSLADRKFAIGETQRDDDDDDDHDYYNRLDDEQMDDDDEDENRAEKFKAEEYWDRFIDELESNDSVHAMWWMIKYLGAIENGSLDAFNQTVLEPMKNRLLKAMLELATHPKQFWGLTIGDLDWAISHLKSKGINWPELDRIQKYLPAAKLRS